MSEECERIGPFDVYFTHTLLPGEWLLCRTERKPWESLEAYCKRAIKEKKFVKIRVSPEEP